MPCSSSFGSFLNADGDADETPSALFESPDPSSTSFDAYTAMIEDSLPVETPILFGMHPNAEIGHLTSTAKNLLSAIMTLAGNTGEDTKDDKSTTNGASKLTTTLESLMDQLPAEFNMVEVQERADPKLKDADSPFVLVALQECTNMNDLLVEMRRSLDELQKGQNGTFKI